MDVMSKNVEILNCVGVGKWVALYDNFPTLVYPHGFINVIYQFESTVYDVEFNLASNYVIYNYKNSGVKVEGEFTGIKHVNSVCAAGDLDLEEPYLESVKKRNQGMDVSECWLGAGMTDCILALMEKEFSVEEWVFSEENFLDELCFWRIPGEDVFVEGCRYFSRKFGVRRYIWDDFGHVHSYFLRV